MKTFNKRLGILIAGSVARIQVARSKDDVLAVVRAFRKFERKGRVGFDHRNLYLAFLILLGLSVLIWLAAWYFVFARPGFDDDDIPFFLILNLAVLAAPLFWVSRKNNRLGLLSDQIAERWLWLDRGLEDKSFLIASLWPHWRYTFGEFAHGDEDRHLVACLSGRYLGDEHEFEYFYYTFEYTVVKDVTLYDPARKRMNHNEMRTVERRYGIVCDFPYARGIAVVGGGGEFAYPANWKTASLAFNKRFRVLAGSEQDAARFLTPAMLLALEKMAPVLSHMNLEINSQGRLCLSFSNDLLKIARSSSLVHPSRFELRLQQEAAAPIFMMALQLIHTLLKYSDNNFADNKLADNRFTNKNFGRA